MEAEDLGARLRACRDNAEATVSCRRVSDAFALIDDVDTLKEISVGPVLLGQRVTVVLNDTVDGNVRSYDSAASSVEVVLDNGSILSVPERDVIPLIHEPDTHLSYVSRMVWAQALSEGRLPLSGGHILPTMCPWEMCESAFQLTQPWTEDLWNAPAILEDIGFNSWLYLFAESFRMKAKDSLMLSLRIVEESTKHVLEAENAGPSSLAHKRFVAGVGEFIKYHPTAVYALGNKTPGGENGAFSLLRHMISTHAVKVLRAIVRKPQQTDMGGEVTVDKMLLKRRCKYYVDMECTAENELRSRSIPAVSGVEAVVLSCVSIFGDGQSSWNEAWLCSADSDAAGVCRALRRGIEQTDASGDSDIVSAKARWDLAGYMTLGGEGDTYDLREVEKLAKSAELFSEKLDTLGMKFFVDGESICASMVKGILSKYSGKSPHVVAAQSLSSSTSGRSAPVGANNACANCHKKSDKLMMCGKCKQVKYCSRDCQVAHFKSGHKKVCK